MIKLKKTSYWVRVAYLLQADWQRPTQTNICTLFWRAVFYAVCLSGGVVLAGLAVAEIAVLVWMYPKDWAVGLGIALGLVASIFAAIYGIVKVCDNELTIRSKFYNLTDGVAESVPVQAFIGWKERHCQLVRIEDE